MDDNAPGYRRFTTTTHKNTSQALIEITEDRLRILVREHMDAQGQTQDWRTALGLVISVIACLCAATFRDFMFKANVWEALFILLAVLSSIWLCIAVVNAWMAPRIDDLMRKIKDE